MKYNVKLLKFENLKNIDLNSKNNIKIIKLSKFMRFKLITLYNNKKKIL